MKQPVKPREPNAITEEKGPGGPVSIYLLDENKIWIDGVRGGTSRSAVVNEAVRFYRAWVERKRATKTKKP